MMNTLQIKFLLREWRAKETRLLLMALIIAVTMLSMLGFYTERMQKTIDQNAAEFLGGDIVVTSPIPIPQSWKKQAAKTGCRYTLVIMFPTMASTEGQVQLANVKAVTQAYPLYGHLSINNGSTTINTTQLPASGTVWIDPQFLKLLNIKLNDTIQLGYATLKVTHLLTHEPDASPFGLTFAPRILMNEVDLEKTQTVQAGSRVEYRFYLAGERKRIEQYKKWLTPQLQPSQRLTTIHQGSAELSRTLQKSAAFLHITAIICTLLAGIAIAASARYFIQRQTATIALLKSFGLVYNDILKIFCLYFFSLAVIGSSIGCISGYTAQLALGSYLSKWLTMTLLPASLWPALASILLGSLILFGFSLPALSQLKNITPLWILHKHATHITPISLSLYLTAAILLIALLAWFIKDIILIILIVSGLGITAAGLFGAAWLMITALRPLRAGVGVSWRYGLASLVRRKNHSITQIVTFGFIFMVVLLQFMIRNDLTRSWDQQLPKQAPNIFAINIQPTEVKQFSDTLKQLSLQAKDIYPMVRGRLTTLNGQPIKQAVPLHERNNNTLNRELNLSWTDDLPESNRITAGVWWKPSDKGKPLVSISQDLANRLEIKPKDKLGFAIGSQAIEVTVQSLRAVEWYSFQPNFVMLFPDSVLNNFPTTYITSFYIGDNKLALAQLNQQFPSVTLIDIGTILTKLRAIMEQVTLASNYLLLFILLAAIIVLNTSVLTSQEERLYESAILRSLGATRWQLYASLLAEFTTIGFIAGLLAVVGATLTTSTLAINILKIIPHFNIGLSLATPIITAIIIGLLGALNSYKTIAISPLKTIKEIT